MIILKLGGSVITDKFKPFTIRTRVVKRLAREINESNKKIILVHGGGSFGHPIASKHRVQNGLKSPDQIEGVAKTRIAMMELSQRIVEILISEGLPAVSIQTSAIFACKNKRINRAGIGMVMDFLSLGLLPVLYGDVVLDEAIGVCILSGDQIVNYLARHLEPEKVVLGVDVDGVFDPKGRLITKITPLKAVGIMETIKVSKGDVTGGMKGKIEELTDLSREQVPSFVVNALKKDRLKNALLGKKVKGTLFEVGK